MGKKIRLIILIAVLAAAFAVIYAVYGKLKKEYAPDQFAEVKTEAQDRTPESAELHASTESASAAESVNTDTEDKDSAGAADAAHDAGGQTEESDFMAPDFSVADSEGNAVRLSGLRGKPVVVNFWATWCPYCKEEMPLFEEAYQKNPDIQFMMLDVTDGDRETMGMAKDYIEKQGFTFPVYYDTQLEATIRYGASALPMTLFINKEGELVTYVSGALSRENLEKGLSLIR